MLCMSMFYSIIFTVSHCCFSLCRVRNCSRFFHRKWVFYKTGLISQLLSSTKLLKIRIPLVLESQNCWNLVARSFTITITSHVIPLEPSTHNPLILHPHSKNHSAFLKNLLAPNCATGHPRRHHARRNPSLDPKAMSTSLAARKVCDTAERDRKSQPIGPDSDSDSDERQQ